MTKPFEATNRALLLPYVLPYAVYVMIASLPLDWIGPEWNYALRLTAATAALVWAWRQYVPLTGPYSPLVSSASGVVIGLVGAVVWVKLLTPFAGTDAEPWSRVGFGLRLTAAGLVVPVFEELLIRGYVLRVALQWDRARTAQCDSAFGEAFDNRSISEVEPGAWTWWAVIISTAAFALGHTTAEWPAALAYGLLMAGLWIACKDLLSCVIAHGVTNVALALYVWTSGAWQLWP